MFAIPFHEVIFSSAINTWLFFVSAFAILGGGIKYIDDAFDEGTFSKFKAMLLAPVLGIFWAYTMSLNPAAATILAAVVLAVFFAGKINTIPFVIGTLIIISVLLFSGLVDFLWIPLAVLIIAGILDEKGNDFVDSQPNINRFIWMFFEHRFVMKLAVFALAFLGFFEWVYFVAFIAFDVAYDLLMLYSKRLAAEKKLFDGAKKDNKV